MFLTNWFACDAAAAAAARWVAHPEPPAAAAAVDGPAAAAAVADAPAAAAADVPAPAVGAAFAVPWTSQRSNDLKKAQLAWRHQIVWYWIESVALDQHYPHNKLPEPQ